MIEIANLTFGYGNHKLFDDINLSLKAGHIYGLLGKNGAGKSTLLKSITGLVFPWQGTCTINGFVADKRLPAFLQELFFVPEDIYLPTVTAQQFADSTAHFYPKFNRAEFVKTLSEFDVPLDSILTKMSFGQQKKAMIAFALATNTALLVMDEPTNGLDIPSKSQFRKVIASALTEDRCIIISTHQVRDLDNLIDSVLILHDQKIVVAKSLDEIAEKVNFGITQSTDYIYGEEGIAGISAISLNTDGGYSKVDMELLFNAITENNKTLSQILNSTAHE